jgi:hypothetical protein
MNELKTKSEDKIEIVKQQLKKQTLVLDKKIVLQRGHFIFEYNKKTKLIKLADYEPPKEVIYYDEALDMYHKRITKKIDIFNAKTKTISKVIKRENCIYIPCLNKNNVIKILQRDYNIKAS